MPAEDCTTLLLRNRISRCVLAESINKQQRHSMMGKKSRTIQVVNTVKPCDLPGLGHRGTWGEGSCATTIEAVLAMFYQLGKQKMPPFPLELA